MSKDNRGSRGDTIGLDLGDKASRWCAMDRAGQVVGEGTAATTKAGMRKHFGKRERCLVAMEAGSHSAWVSRYLEAMGYEVIVANPRKLRWISESDRKSDEADARALAEFARTNKRLLYPVKHRGEGAQKSLAVIKARDALVRSRALLVNHVRGSVKVFGERVPSGSTDAFPKRARKALPADLRMVHEKVLEVIEKVTEEIREYDRWIEEMAEQAYPETGALTQVAGVGKLTALSYMLILESPGRFRRGRSVGNYLGLTPKRKQSSSEDPQLPISKAGNSLMRRLLVGSAHYILGPFGPDTDLRRFGQRIAARGAKNAKKRAVVAVARKLSALLFSLWRTGEVYEPLRHSQDAA